MTTALRPRTRTDHPQPGLGVESAARPAPGPLTAALRRAVVARLAHLAWGRVDLVEGGRTTRSGSDASVAAGAPSVRLEVQDPGFWWAAATRGSVGVGESYAAGHWRCDDLTGLVRVFCRNREALASLDGGLARLAGRLLRAAHALRPNTRSGSRRNIAAHYDLGNDLYERMLDETWTYSSALYEREDSTLHEAQLAKLERICDRLDLRPGDEVVELGTGWGGFAVHAAATRGCRVTTTTISRAQHEVALRRVREAGLEDRVTVLLEDYRDLPATLGRRFDKLVSIEMIEAIGWRQYPTFFATCEGLLEPHGLALVQAITILDSEYERAKEEVDYIKAHVFPGCCIPSVAALTGAMAGSSDLRLAGLEDLTPHYARTLRDWRANVDRRRAELDALGYDEAFLRGWEFYLRYCEGGFQERVIQVGQLLFVRPGADVPRAAGA